MDATRKTGVSFYQLTNERRWDDLLALIASDYVGHGLGGGGRDGIRQDLEAFASAFPDLHFTIEDTIAEGDNVVVKTTIRGTHHGAFAGVPASGNSIQVGGCELFRVQDGKIAEAWTLCDSGMLFMQIGAVPTLAGR